MHSEGGSAVPAQAFRMLSGGLVGGVELRAGLAAALRCAVDTEIGQYISEDPRLRHFCKTQPEIVILGAIKGPVSAHCRQGFSSDQHRGVGQGALHKQVALDIASNLHCFDLVAWTFDFYGEHRDIGIDLESRGRNINLPGLVRRLAQQPAAARLGRKQAENDRDQQQR